MDKSLSTISQKCPTCGKPYEWKTWEDLIENLQMLRLICRQCGKVETYGIPREELADQLLERCASTRIKDITMEESKNDT